MPRQGIGKLQLGGNGIMPGSVAPPAAAASRPAVRGTCM